MLTIDSVCVTPIGNTSFFPDWDDLALEAPRELCTTMPVHTTGNLSCSLGYLSKRPPDDRRWHRGCFSNVDTPDLIYSVLNIQLESCQLRVLFLLKHP